MDQRTVNTESRQRAGRHWSQQLIRPTIKSIKTREFWLSLKARIDATNRQRWTDTHTHIPCTYKGKDTAEYQTILGRPA